MTIPRKCCFLFSVFFFLYSILKGMVKQINLVKNGPSAERFSIAGVPSLHPILREETDIKRIEISTEICDIGVGCGE
jgi:hypothetical protein